MKTPASSKSSASKRKSASLYCTPPKPKSQRAKFKPVRLEQGPVVAGNKSSKKKAEKKRKKRQQQKQKTEAAAVVSKATAAAAVSKESAAKSSGKKSSHVSKTPIAESQYEITEMTHANLPDTKTKVYPENFRSFILAVVLAGLADNGKFALIAIYYLISFSLSLRGMLSHSQHKTSGGSRKFFAADDDDNLQTYSAITVGTKADYHRCLLKPFAKNTGWKATAFRPFDEIKKWFFPVKLKILEKNQDQTEYVRLMPIFILRDRAKLVKAAGATALDITKASSIIGLIQQTLSRSPHKSDRNQFGSTVQALVKQYLFNDDTAPRGVDPAALCRCSFMRSISSNLVLSSLVKWAPNNDDIVDMLQAYLGHIDKVVSEWYTRFEIYDSRGRRRMTVWVYHDGTSHIRYD